MLLKISDFPCNFENDAIKTQYIAVSLKINYTFCLFGKVFLPNFKKNYKVTLELIFLLENIWTFRYNHYCYSHPHTLVQ